MKHTLRLGGKLMDKDWQKFTMTGSIQDYLSYCHKERQTIVNANQNKQTGEKKDGTNHYGAWNGDSITTYR